MAEPGHNFTIVSDDIPPAAVTATVLSHLGKHGPMLVVESDAVPEDVASYLEEIKPSYVAPNEALFNHAWSIGGEDTFSPGVQADIDELRNVNRRSTEFVTATFEGTVRLLYGCHEPGPRGGDGGYGGYRGLKVRCTTLGPGFEDCPEPGHLCSSSMRQSASPQGGGFFGSSSLARAGRRWRERRRTRQARATEVGYFDIYPPDDQPDFNGAWSNYPFFASGVVVISGIEEGLFVVQPRLREGKPGRGGG